MFDHRNIRANREFFTAKMRERGVEAKVITKFFNDDNRCRNLETKIQGIQEWLNKTNDDIITIKRQGLDTSTIVAIRKKRKEEQIEMKKEWSELTESVREQLLSFPNILADDVPEGIDECDNVVVKQIDCEIDTSSFKDHVTVAENMGWMDTKKSNIISGARFFYLSGPLAKMERIISNHMMMHNSRCGFEEVIVPTMVKESAMVETGKLPKFADQSYKIEGEDMWLIPTAEVPLTMSYASQTLPTDFEPIRLTALTDCFRSEAGAAGKDTRGLIRQHQFKKAELVTICREEDVQAELDHMLETAEQQLAFFGIPYRIIKLCKGDTGDSSAITYDIEVWMASQNTYREIASISHCGTYQSSRMNTRYGVGREKKFAHTLNGSSLAVGRLLAAILEYYQVGGKYSNPIHLEKLFRNYGFTMTPEMNIEEL